MDIEDNIDNSIEESASIGRSSIGRSSVGNTHLSQYQVEDLLSNLSTMKVSALLQFAGEDSHIIDQLYLDYKIGIVNKRICAAIIMFSVPLWLLRTPLYFERGENALFSLAWLFYILGFGIPAIVLLLKIDDDSNFEANVMIKIPDDSNFEAKIGRSSKIKQSDLVLVQRIQLIISVCSPLAVGLLLLARTLSGQCSFDNIQLVNSNTCNPEYGSSAVPQDQVFIVGIITLLVSVFFKTPVLLTLISHIECNVMIAVAVFYFKQYNSVWTLIITSTLPLMLIYEYEREQMNIFLSLLKSHAILSNSKAQNEIIKNATKQQTTNDKKTSKAAKETRKDKDDTRIAEVVQPTAGKMKGHVPEEFSKEQSVNSDNYHNLETITTNSLGSAAFTERRRQYINDNFGDYENYSDFSEALESKSVESTIESVPEGNVAIIQEPSSPTADIAYRAAYMRSLAVSKIMDFVPCSMEQFNHNSISPQDEMIDRSKIDRLLITHRNLVVELENRKKDSTSDGDLGSFWKRIDDFLQELDKYRTQNEVERQLLDYMTRSALNFKNRK